MASKPGPSKKNRIHLICNAHIDPVWLWQWPEGAAETLSTFRTAVEICENNDNFVFNHNEAILYKWIAEYDPQLLARIKKLVKQGKWHIMGGWYLQPDCNMPSGESFVRQILKGKNYFRKEFGRDVTTAINFDPFGHSRGLVQILAKSGYDSYLFGRPRAEDNMHLPANTFRWIGFDGSSVTAVRFDFPYTSQLGKAREKALTHIEKRGHEPVSVMLWGGGNHGGGPSRKDIKDLNDLIRDAGQIEIVHSTPENYIKDMLKEAAALPDRRNDLNPWAVGCYTSMIKLKQMHRELENEIFAAEKMSSTASAQGLMEYPREEIDQAVHDLMMSEFHDTLPGSAIEPVEYDSRNTLGHGLDIISRVRTRAFFALASGQKKPKAGRIPLLVYNHHPYEVEDVISCEFSLADNMSKEDYKEVDVYCNGKILASQVEKELSNIHAEWRKKVVFRARLKPGQMNRFDCEIKDGSRPEPVKYKSAGKCIKLGNSRLTVAINTTTGLIDEYAANNKSYICGSGFEPLAIKDDADPWGMVTDSFPNIEGRFKLMSPTKAAKFAGVPGKLEPVRVIEDGQLRTVVEAMFQYDESAICQRYIIPKEGTEMGVETIVHWNQKDTMLKLQIPLQGNKLRYIGQTAYGVQELPTDGTEAVSQRWSAVINQKSKCAITCVDDGIYGSDFTDNNWRLTLLRSPVYSAHPCAGDKKLHMPNDRYLPRIDQGVRKYRFWFDAGKSDKRLEAVEREAQIKNERLFTLPYFPAGQGSKAKPLVKLADNLTVLTAAKQAENDKSFVFRLFEPTGKKRKTAITIPLIRKRVNVNLGPFEVKTYKVNIRSGRVIETDLLERPLRKKRRK